LDEGRGRRERGKREGEVESVGGGERRENEGRKKDRKREGEE